MDDRGLGIAKAVFAAVVSDAFEHAVPACTEWTSVASEYCSDLKSLRLGL
jgi:hypothetical protein